MTESAHTPLITSSGIVYADTGPRSGLTIVLIHGSLDRMAGMAHVSRLLQKEWRVLRYDRRGYGKSVHHDGPFAVSDHVNDLFDVISSAGEADPIENVLLIGHSFGGHVALAGAITDDACVVGVSMYESPLSWMPWWPGTTAGNMAISRDSAEAAETFMRRLVGDAKWESLPESTKDARRREGKALVGELTALRAGAPYDFSAAKSRVLCGYGEHGATRHHDGARYVSEHVQRGELVMITGAGHGAPTSHPNEYIEVMIRPHLQNL